jgi:hypothetical protein
MKPNYEVLPPVKKVKQIGCLCCGSNIETHLDLETVLYQGFGGWMITRDGKLFFMDDVNKEWDQFKTLEFIENKAKKDANHDWKAICDTPLHGEVYQRQRGKWLLVEQNQGFA